MHFDPKLSQLFDIPPILPVQLPKKSVLNQIKIQDVKMSMMYSTENVYLGNI